MYGLSAKRMAVVEREVDVSGGLTVSHFIETEDFFYSQCVSQVFLLCYSDHDVTVMELFQALSQRIQDTPSHTHTYTHPSLRLSNRVLQSCHPDLNFSAIALS